MTARSVNIFPDQEGVDLPHLAELGATDHWGKIDDMKAKFTQIGQHIEEIGLALVDWLQAQFDQQGLNMAHCPDCALENLLLEPLHIQLQRHPR